MVGMTVERRAVMRVENLVALWVVTWVGLMVLMMVVKMAA